MLRSVGAWAVLLCFTATHALALPLAAVPSTALVPGGAGLRPHGPISILSDGGFLLPDAVSGNGVVGGTGTEMDPFVIEGWEIAYEWPTPAVSIQDTRLHVVLRDLLIRPAQAPTPSTLSIGPAISLASVSNVSLERVRIEEDWDGSLFQDSQVHVKDVTLANSTILAYGGTLTGSHVTSHGASRHGMALICNACWLDVRDVRSHGYGPVARFADMQPIEPGGIGVVDSPSANLQRLEARNMSRGNVVAVTDSRLVWRGGALSGGALGLSATRSAVTISDVRLDEEDEASGFAYLEASETEMTSVTVRSGGVAIFVVGGSLRVDRSHFDGVGSGILVNDAPEEGSPPPSVVVRNSSFVGTRDHGLRSDTQAPVDARWNWWGSAEGPASGKSKDGRAGVQGPAVQVDPWLAQGPASEAGSRTAPGVHALGIVAVSVAAALVGRRR